MKVDQLAAASALCLLMGCSSVGGQSADVAATTVGIVSKVGVEANPLGGFVVPIKIIALNEANKLQEPSRTYELTRLHAWGMAGAGQWAGLAVGGPVGSMIGFVGTLAYTWQHDEDVRLLVGECVRHKQIVPTNGWKCEEIYQ